MFDERAAAAAISDERLAQHEEYKKREGFFKLGPLTDLVTGAATSSASNPLDLVTLASTSRAEENPWKRP